MLDKHTAKLDFQFLLSMIPRWAHGDEEPTKMEIEDVGGPKQVEATRRRVDEIKERMKQLSR